MVEYNLASQVVKTTAGYGTDVASVTETIYNTNGNVVDIKGPEIETAAVMGALRIKKNAFPRPVPVVITLKDYHIPSMKDDETYQLVIYIDNMSSVWVDF